MSHATIRCVIVDDEPLALLRLRSFLQRHGDVRLVGEADNADAGADMIRQLHPDVVFLDIEMPGASGFAVLERAGVSPPPLVVFVTAHAEHAVRAFETQALDYLLKPYGADRVALALDRVRDALAARWTTRIGGEMEALMRQVRGASAGEAVAAGPAPLADRIPVTVGKRTVLVRVDDVRWVEADGNYARLHTAARAYLLRSSLTALEERLPRDQFVRIHRSTIVRLESVLELHALGNGDYEVVLDDGTTLTMGQTYRARLPI